MPRDVTETIEQYITALQELHASLYVHLLVAQAKQVSNMGWHCAMKSTWQDLHKTMQDVKRLSGEGQQL